MTEPAARFSIFRRWDALSTAIKMFIILSLGLLPLGIIAIAASIENARENSSRDEAEARAALAVQVQRLTLPLARHAVTIRAARDAMTAAGQADLLCLGALERLSHLPGASARYVLFDDRGTAACASPGLTPPPIPAARGEPSRIVIPPDGNLLRIFLFTPSGQIEGIMEFPRAALAGLINTPQERPDSGVSVALVQGQHRIVLHQSDVAAEPEQQITVFQPLANGQYAMQVTTPAAPFTIADLLIIVTPILMWLWASAIGWLLVRHVLLRPLERIQRAISAYRPGDNALALPRFNSPAHEINALGQSFNAMTRTVARHEAELEAGLERQTKLVREVHHRVKNNLQVVASLLNIHSRGAVDESAASAYASIQRRVDALAVVHRNHYAELEDTRGVALRPLVSELAANLRASAPSSAAYMQIAVDIDPVHVTQDVAVSVAFLATEIVELGMLCGARSITIGVEQEEPLAAMLTIQVDSLSGGPACEPALLERFDRVITGLARQLRSTLERTPDSGRYAIRIPVKDA